MQRAITTSVRRSFQRPYSSRTAVLGTLPSLTATRLATQFRTKNHRSAGTPQLPDFSQPSWSAPKRRGHTTSSSAPNRSGNLRNRNTFPSFHALPVEGYLSGRPRRHWCFLSEIKDLSWFVRLRLDVRDLEGVSVPVFFYTPDEGGAVVEDAEKGYTLAVFYAEQHHFMDGQLGIRVDDAACVKVSASGLIYSKLLMRFGYQVIPFSLEEILAAGDAIFQADADRFGTGGKHQQSPWTPAKDRKKAKTLHARFAGKPTRFQPSAEAMKAAAWFTNRNWDAKTDGVEWRIQYQGVDPVKKSNRQFTEKDWNRFQEQLGVFPSRRRRPSRFRQLVTIGVAMLIVKYSLF